MKNKSIIFNTSKLGFTLIELLAVITILAIILTITIPSVANMLNSSEDSVEITNVRIYINAIDKILISRETNYENVSNGKYRIDANGDIVLIQITEPQSDSYDGDVELQEPYEYNTDNVLEIKVTGKKPNNGYVEISDSKVIKAGITLNSKNYTYNRGSISISD